MEKITGKVMLIGSMPPPIGGTSISLKNLYDDLVESGLEMDLINTSSGKKNRFYLIAIALWSLTFSGRHTHTVSIHLGISALAKFGILFVLISKMTKKKVILRRFGGVCISELGLLQRYSVGLCYWFSDIVLCQTKSQLREIGSKGVWFPTARSENIFPPKKTFPAQVKKVIFVSQIKREKGVFDLMNAFTSLREIYDIELEIYGPILLSSEDSLLFYSEAGGFYKGEIDQQQVSDLLLSSDLLILPTFYKGEGYPGILVEGMLTGIGIISTNWLSIPELVENCAIICEPNSSKSLENAMDYYLSNSSIREKMYSECMSRRVNFLQKNQTEIFLNSMFS